MLHSVKKFGQCMALCAGMVAVGSGATYGGALAGPASELTQLLNNAELAIQSAGQSAQIANEIEGLVRQAEHIGYTLQSLELEARNTIGLTDQRWSRAIDLYRDLDGIVSQTGALLSLIHI